MECSENPSKDNRKAKREQKKRVARARRFIHPALVRGALGELDTFLLAKGGVLVPQGHPQYEVVRSRVLSSLTPTDVATYGRFRRSIVQRLYGTDMPSMWVSLIDAAVTPSSGVLTTVYIIKYTSVNDNSVYTSMFDEYEFQRAELTWVPYRTVGFSAANSLAIGRAVVDYVDGTALTSAADALSYDTVKEFYLENPGAPYRETWSFTFLGPPDIQWIMTGTSQDMGYWKSYAVEGVAGSSTYGVLFGKALVRFRLKHT